jgi:hypothetical protein
VAALLARLDDEPLQNAHRRQREHMRIFLSYQTRDLDPAERLAQGLRRERPDLTIFVAPRAIAAGAYWLPRLADELARADAVLFLVGQRIGPWQELEYYEAYRLSRKAGDNGRPLIVPVVMADHAPGLPFFDLLHHIFAPDPAQADALAAVLAGLAGTATTTQDPPWKRFDPYKGLPALTSADAAFFHGREALTADILNALRPNPETALVLVGASGVGKSSVAQAGVLAALKSELWPGGEDWPAELADSREWLEVTMRPGEAPVKELALAFVRLIVDKGYAQDEEAEGWVRRFGDGARLVDLLRIVRRELDERTGSQALRRFVLYVDQGEELYARAPAAEARRFSTLLAEAARQPDFHVLASLRADYYGHLQGDAALFPVSRCIDVPPLGAEALEAVIHRPAERLGARFDSDEMPARIAAATASEPGALPLLSYLMSDMWDSMQERGDGVLRWSEQSALIDIASPLRERAERYRRANPTLDDTLRRLFTLRLAYVPRQGEPVRRRAGKAECPPAEWAIAETLVGPDWRLLTIGAPTDALQPTVEVAHEQLLRKWPTLTRWLEQHREFLVWKGEIEADRRDWEKLPDAEKPLALLAGRRLLVAQQWLRTHGDDLPDDDRAFVESSVAVDQENRERAAADRERLQDAELRAQGEREAAAALQVELDRLKDLRTVLGDTAPALADEGGAVEIVHTPDDAAAAVSLATAAPTWGVTAVGADRTPYVGKGCVVALLGTGIDAHHPAFRGVTLVQRDFTGEGNGDTNGHSTHTAGSMFGRPVREQRFGAAPGVTEVLIAKVLDASGGGVRDSILAGLRWILGYEGGRVDVVCVALGIDFPGQMSQQIERGAKREVAIAQGLRQYLQMLRVYERLGLASSIGKGTVIVAAAGNDSQEHTRAPVSSPLSVAHGVISVGAARTGPKGYTVAYFSNSFPTLCAPGVDVVSAHLVGELKSLTGTSMACAHAAGVAALWWEYLRSTMPAVEVTSRMVVDAMLKAARVEVFAPDVPDVDRGAGLIQAPAVAGEVPSRAEKRSGSSPGKKRGRGGEGRGRR